MTPVCRPKMKSASTTCVGAGERRIDLAGVEVALEGQIVAERRMNHRRGRIERGAHVRYRLQLLVLDRDDFRGVLRHGAAGRHDGGDGFALPADAIDRNGVLRRGFEALQVREYADPRRDDGGKLLAGHDGDDAGQRPRRVGIDAGDPRMGMGRAQEHHVPHARQFHVADIEPAPLHQPLEVRPRHHLADIGVRPIELGEDFGIRRRDRHAVRLPRARAVVSTASTMAW